MREVLGTFSESIVRTPSVKSYRFIMDEKIHFLPGQFMQLIFDKEHKSNQELNKYLSLSTSPDNDFIEVTKRLSESAFSHKLEALKKGDRLLFKAPLGTCTFDPGYKKIAFLIGGIGITPVISILEYVCQNNLATDVYLLYSNRVPDDVAFKDELDMFSVRKNIKIIYTFTDCEPQDNVCLSGVITKDVVTAMIPDWQERHLFVYGSPAMVRAMKGICSELSCDTGKIKTENFMGY
jgi:glycine betaine catabolism B